MSARRSLRWLAVSILLSVSLTGCGGGCDGCGRRARDNAMKAAQDARQRAADAQAQAAAQTADAARAVKAALARVKVPERSESASNLRRLAQAMQAYQDANGRLPPAASRAPDGRPLLSWRVHVLPQLGEEQLYREFQLDQPWDSPHNLSLLSRMPKVYAPPGGARGSTQPALSSETQPATRPATGPSTLPAAAAATDRAMLWAEVARSMTYYQVFTGPKTVFEEGQTVTLQSIPDGPGETLLIVEAGVPVGWTQPQDVGYTPGGPLPPLGFFGGHFLAVTCNGSLRGFLGPPALYEAELRPAITRNGGEPARSSSSSGHHDWDD